MYLENSPDYKSKLDKILDHLFSLQRFGIKPGLERTETLMEKFSVPHNKFKSIHVAGTNGKGSVSSLIASILMEAGYKTGLYTSPHLIRFNERIKINGKEISDSDLKQLAVEFLKYQEETGLTFFEITTGMAFKYFADNKVDFAIIETGMGGRFDSTNVIMPVLSLITNIDYDHQEYLGNSIESIAFEKAGIIKKGIPVIIQNNPECEYIFRDVAKQKGSELNFVNDLVSSGNLECYEGLDFRVDINTKSEKFKSLQLMLPGNHQVENLKQVIGSLVYLKKLANISNQNIIDGINKVVLNTGLRARIELIKKDPPKIIDTAHNPGGIKVLVDTIGSSGFRNNKWDIIFGAMKDKNIDEMLEILSPIANQFLFIDINTERAIKADELIEKANNLKINNSIIFKLSEDSINKILNNDNPTIFCGSFYLIGEIFQFIDKNKKG